MSNCEKNRTKWTGSDWERGWNKSPSPLSIDSALNRDVVFAMYSCPILIAETDSSTLEALPRVLHDNAPEIYVDLCTSIGQALRLLDRQQYGVLVTSVHLAQSQDGLMLNRLHALQAL